MTWRDGSAPTRGGQREHLRGHVEVVSTLAAPAGVVWRDATNLARVNAELAPWLRMTRPRGWDTLSSDRVPLGRRMFRSWLLLGGVLPVDYDDLTLVELEPGRRFLERSTMLSATVWEHERVVEHLTPAACRLTDRVRFAPRTVLHGRVLGRLVPWVFAHRHRRLRRRYGRHGR